MNKEEFDSDFNPNCDNCDNIQHVSANDTQLPNNIPTTASTSFADFSDQFQRLNVYMTKTQNSIATETSDGTALNAVDPNIKKQVHLFTSTFLKNFHVLSLFYYFWTLGVGWGDTKFGCLLLGIFCLHFNRFVKNVF